LVLEAILPVDETTVYPGCLARERTCPPEDCDGSWGYERFLEAQQDPKHEDHESYMEWGGECVRCDGSVARLIEGA
jgi:hypothetical protein